MSDMFEPFRQRLSGYESQIDLDLEWAALRNRHNPRNNRRRWAVLLLLLLIGGCGAGWWWQYQHKNRQPMAAQQQVKQQPAASQPVYTSPLPNSETALTNNATLYTSRQNLQHISNSTPVLSASVLEPGTDTRTTEHSGAANPKPETVPAAQFTIPETVALPIRLAPEPKPCCLITSGLSTPETIKKATPNRLAWYIGGGAGYTTQHLEARTDTATTYADRRRQTESALETRMVQVGVRYQLGRKAFAGLDLQYQQWYNRLNYTFDRPKDYLIENTLLQLIRLEATGAENRTWGDTTVAGTQTVSLIHYNRYQSVDLHLSMGYEWWQHQRWRMAVSGGLAVSLKGQSRGVIASPDPSQVITLPGQVYKNSFGAGVSVAASLDYYISPRLAIRCQPAAAWWLTDAATEASPVSAKLRRYGATLGLVYRH